MTLPTSREISPPFVAPEFLVYLEFVRFVSAVVVVFDHLLTSAYFGQALFLMPSGLGHLGVVVFFVLSGFIMQWRRTVCKETSIEYISNRISRIYSVLILALLFTPIIDFIGMQASIQPYSLQLDDRPILRLIIHGFLLQSFWTLGVGYFSNSPLWTLSFEAVYYACYWFVFYARKPFFALLLLLCAGPKVVLLAPLWMLGVAVLPLSQIAVTWSKLTRWLLGLFSLVLFALSFVIQYPVASLFGIPLAGATIFFSDYFAGAAVGLHFVLVAAKPFRFAERLSSLIKWLASFSYELYALHMPIIVLFIAYFGGKSSGVAVLSLGTCFVIALGASKVASKLKIILRRYIRVCIERIQSLVTDKQRT
jgi:peptidoglycan/LPS O-acetylase OafA/YrhL